MGAQLVKNKTAELNCKIQGGEAFQLSHCLQAHKKNHIIRSPPYFWNKIKHQLKMEILILQPTRFSGKYVVI